MSVLENSLFSLGSAHCIIVLGSAQCIIIVLGSVHCVFILGSAYFLCFRECSEPTLKRFGGKATDYSPRAKIRQRLGYVQHKELLLMPLIRG